MFKKQLENKSCGISDGPNCFYLMKNININDSDYYKKILEKIRFNSLNDDLNIDIVSQALTKELSAFKEKHKQSMNEVFKFTPKIMMNLLLTFESYDQTTLSKDVYMPEEKVVNFNVGYLKLSFKGKLRLTQDRNTKANPHQITHDGPSKTYGVIEERDLYLKFDKPVLIKYFYIRKRPENVPAVENKYKQYEMSVAGYLKEKKVYEKKVMMPVRKEWTKIQPSQSVIDAIRFPKDFEIDDVQIAHDSEFSDTQEENSQLTTILQTVIDEIMDQNNKRQFKDEDL
jgi:hypothetical protein